MNLTKILLLPISLIVSVAGCAGIGPNATYYMATVSINYNPTYASYMVKLNGNEIGGGYGRSVNTSAVKLGPQVIKWEESNSNKFHQAKNQVRLTKADLKGMKYLAVHLYPDDTVEITTSNNWPNPTAKGDAWYDKIKNEMQGN